ncbi:MAG: Ig-like domain-containing domain [bacterium]
MDTTPPEVLLVEPADGSLWVDPHTEIKVTFSEPINLSTVSEALFITPSFRQSVKLGLRGRNLIIQPPSPFPPQTTVVVTLGTSLRDLRGNRMKGSFSWAFSTGGEIAQGEIGGRVFSETNPEGMLVGTWLVDESPRDSLAFPPYATMVSRDGGFRLAYLPPGRYRLFLWDDKDRNRIYRPGVELLGIPWDDLEVQTGQSSCWMEFIPFKEDTTDQMPLTLHLTDPAHLVVRWARRWKSADDSSVTEKLRVIWDDDTFGVKGRIIDPNDSSRIIFILPTPSREVMVGETLKITLGEWSHFARVVSPQDTSPPQILWTYPRDGEREVSPDLQGMIIFDDFLGEEPPPSFLTLTVSDSLNWEVDWDWDGGARIIWKPRSSLPPLKRVVWELKREENYDLFGNRGDSTIHIGISPFDPSDRGSISGQVESDRRLGEQVRVSLVPVGRARSQRLPMTFTSPDGYFHLAGVPEGRYRLWVFLDRNGDGQYTLGSRNPFVPSEPFTVGKDTLEVKKRWEIADVKIHLP